LVSQKEVMPTIEGRLRRLHTYAIELRKLAYTLPKAVGECIFLQLSERMSAAREEAVPSSTGPVIFRLDSEAAKAAVANMGPSVAGVSVTW
jgi:hypothetical protein